MVIDVTAGVVAVVVLADGQTPFTNHDFEVEEDQLVFWWVRPDRFTDGLSSEPFTVESFERVELGFV